MEVYDPKDDEQPKGSPWKTTGVAVGLIAIVSILLGMWLGVDPQSLIDGAGELVPG